MLIESAAAAMRSIAKAWRTSDCMAGLDWGCIRCFSSSGEASNPEDYHWLMARAGAAIVPRRTHHVHHPSPLSWSPSFKHQGTHIHNDELMGGAIN